MHRRSRVLPAYITTPIYYVNDVPHIGHAYTGVIADAFARWQRLRGHQTMLVTGTDEHGQKIARAAEIAGTTPRAFTDRVSARFRDLARRMRIEDSSFIRTTEPRHRRAVQHLWETIDANGYIRLGTYTGWYAVRDEAFYAEGDTKVGDDGVRRAVATGAEVERISEPSYFFTLSKFRDQLLRFYDQNPDFIRPESRRNEVIAMVQAGLPDLSISRASVKWGIPVPDNEAHTVYVWMDALTNYLTAIGYPERTQRWEFWPDVLHIVGKDILKFHAIYWPAFLMAANLKPPRAIFAHGWWTNEGQKISKSLGNTIDPLALADQYGVDAVRYYLLKEIPLGRDGDFKLANLIARNDSELANELGNLIHRVLSILQKHDHGRLPPVLTDEERDDDEILSRIETLPTRVGLAMEHYYSPSEALDEIWQEIRACNAWVNDIAPWKIKDPVAKGKALRAFVEAFRIIGTVLIPFIPDSAHRILDHLSVPQHLRKIDDLTTPIPEGTALPTPTPIFTKIGVDMKVAAE